MEMGVPGSKVLVPIGCVVGPHTYQQADDVDTVCGPPILLMLWPVCGGPGWAEETIYLRCIPGCYISPHPIYGVLGTANVPIEGWVIHLYEYGLPGLHLK